MIWASVRCKSQTIGSLQISSMLLFALIRVVTLRRSLQTTEWPFGATQQPNT